MTPLYVILGVILGAVIPSYLLWQKTRECEHLLNIILKREKVATTNKPFTETPTDETTATPAYLEKKSMPTAIDAIMTQAEIEDTKKYGPKV